MTEQQRRFYETERAEWQRKKRAEIDDFRRAMNAHRTQSIIAPDGTAPRGHDCARDCK